MAERSTEQIALALVQAHRARLPEPEELLASEAPAPQGPRPGFEASAWFRINIGRDKNADPKWLMPTICRLGHVTKRDIGSIKIFERETKFEINEQGDCATRGFAAAGFGEIDIASQLVRTSIANMTRNICSDATSRLDSCTITPPT